MDIKRYIEKKALGLAEVVKAGGGYALAFKTWNTEKWEEGDPEIQAVNIETLSQQKEDLKAQIADIDALLADIKALG